MTLAKKKAKRQCSSKRVLKSKATAELPKQDPEYPGIAGTRKQEGKSTLRPTMLHPNGYVKVSSARLAQF